MLTVAWIIGSVVVGGAMGVLMRIGFSETTPARYRERWGVRPLSSAVLITACFLLYIAALAGAVAGIDLGGLERLAVLGPWAGTAVAVCLPAVWRLAAADIGQRADR